jgi:hypothetical protein
MVGSLLEPLSSTSGKNPNYFPDIGTRTGIIYELLTKGKGHHGQRKEAK